MKCPNCNVRMAVEDCRNSTTGKEVVRQRQCSLCRRQVRTYEILEEDYKILAEKSFVEEIKSDLELSRAKIEASFNAATAILDQHLNSLKKIRVYKT